MMCLKTLNFMCKTIIKILLINHADVPWKCNYNKFSLNVDRFDLKQNDVLYKKADFPIGYFI